MSLEIQTLQRIALTEESLANFATDLTGSATYLDLPFQEGTAQLQLLRPNLEPQTAQQLIDGYPLGVLGPKQAALTVTCVLAPTGQAAGNGVAAPLADSAALLQLLEIIFGGVSENTGSTFATVTDADTFTFTDPSEFPDGGAFGWADANGIFHARELGNAPVPKQALPSAPSVSDPAYAALTYYLGDNPSTTIQMIVEGAEQSDRWLLMGGQITAPPVINLPIGQLPTIQFTITFADWAREPEQAISAASYPNFSPEYVSGGVRAQVGATTTLQEIAVASTQWTLNSPVYAPVTSPGGTNTISRFRRQRAVPAAEVQFTLPYEDDAWFTARDDRALYHFEQQIGNAAGKVILLTAPTMQIWDVQRVDQGGLAYQQITGRATNDAYASSQNVEIRRSAYRMHFL